VWFAVVVIVVCQLENVMFAAPGGRRVKVIDLGLSSSITPGRLLRSYCGSVEYAAPEVLLRQVRSRRRRRA
jgi:serine/threonine protein kinase